MEYPNGMSFEGEWADGARRDGARLAEDSCDCRHRARVPVSLFDYGWQRAGGGAEG
jgi:hypothetical protein